MVPLSTTGYVSNSEDFLPLNKTVALYGLMAIHDHIHWIRL